MLGMHRLLLRAALAAGNIFAWVVVFRVFFIASADLEFSLAGAAALYALSHAITFVCTPLAGASLRRGVRTALIFGTVLASLSFGVIACIFASDPARDQLFWAIGAFAVLQGLYRAFYFVPYAASTNALSLSSIYREGLIAISPAIAGYVLTAFADGAFLLFAVCTLLALVAAFVVVRMPQSYESYDWSYRETLHELSARKNHRAIGLFILDGMQGAVLLLIWPLAIFLTLSSFRALGAVMAATLCLAFLGRFIVRRMLRVLRAQSPIVLATIAFTTWIVKLAAASPVQILAVNVAYSASNSPVRFSIDTHAGEQAADGGRYIDEYTALKEMGLSIGRISMALLFIVLVLVTAEALAFAAAIITAACAAAWSVVLAYRLQRDAY